MRNTVRITLKEKTPEKDAMVKGLRDMFRRKSSCEGQIIEMRVLESEIEAWQKKIEQGETFQSLDTYLVDVLSKRRESLQAQLGPIDKEIAATKNALRGTEY